MKILGIIAEYNPFHNGHLYHLNQSKKISGSDVSVAVMSGNFTQRGEPAVWDKWTRAEIAVNNGVDLVLELPFVYACNSAEFFAKGSIEILEALGCVTHLSFGSEEGSVEILQELAKYFIQEPQEYQENLKFNLKKGFSFPKARALAIEAVLGREYSLLMKESNNILAIEYLKQLQRIESKITPITVKRIGSKYSDGKLANGYPSALAIRRAMKTDADYSGYIPYSNIGKEYKNIFAEDFYPFIVQAVLNKNRDALSHMLSVGEGLENKMKLHVREAKSLEHYIDLVATKRYPRTRIKRMLFHVLMDLSQSPFDQIASSKALYSRVLAFNQRGARLLREMKKSEKKSHIKILTNINKEIEKEDAICKSLSYDILASDIYNLIAGNPLYENCDYVKKPYYKKD